MSSLKQLVNMCMCALCIQSHLSVGTDLGHYTAASINTGLIKLSPSGHLPLPALPRRGAHTVSPPLHTNRTRYTHRHTHPHIPQLCNTIRLLKLEDRNIMPSSSFPKHLQCRDISFPHQAKQRFPHVPEKSNECQARPRL